MRVNLLLLSILSVFLIPQQAYTSTNSENIAIPSDQCTDENVSNIFLCGTFSGRVKSLYFSSHNAYFIEDLNQDTAAVGGFIKFETHPLHQWKAGLSYAGQWRLDDKKFNQAEVAELKQEKDGLAEAYIAWGNDTLNFKVGQQALDVPFLGDYDWRIMPVAYRALDLEYTTAQDFYRLTAVNGFKSYADDRFTKTSRYSDVQHTDGMWSIGLGKKLPSKDGLTLKGELWYQSYLDYNHLIYAEGHAIFSDKSYQPDVGLQLMYSKQQGEAYAGDINHQGIGISLALKLTDFLSFKSAYNYIKPDDNSYLNGALFAPYMIYTASGPYFAQPFFTSTQDLGAGHAYLLALEGQHTEKTYWGINYSFMDLKESAELKSLNQSEYVVYVIHHLSGAFKGWSISNFAGLATSPRSDHTFLQNRLGLSYKF